MAKNRTQTWLALVVGGMGLLLLAIPGLWVYMSATAKSLHPNPAGVPSVTQTVSPKWTAVVERARKTVRAGLSEQNLPGVSVAIGKDGEILWAEGLGYLDLDSQSPVTPEHRFRIGTASTVLTSAAAGLLVEEGRLKLDEPIQTYVPEFPEKQWPVTVRHLMSHTAGLKNDGGDEGALFGRHCKGPAEALPHFGGSPLLFEPGTQYRYSRYGWIPVSAAMETAARKPFLALMQERVFDPAGMHDTAADSLEPMPDRATFYFPRFSADPKYGLHLMREFDLSCYAGSSVFLSTPSDLVRFAMAMQSGRLLRRETAAMMQTSQRLASGRETGYGLGWDVESVTFAGRATRVVGHNGDVLGGMIASLVTFPEQQIAVAVTSNMSYADTFSMAVKIAEAFNGRD